MCETHALVKHHEKTCEETRRYEEGAYRGKGVGRKGQRNK